MNETVITVCGRVVADPEHRSTGAGTQFTTFRVASTVRRRNREGVFVDGPTSFYNVAAYRSVGMNSHTSLRKGDPVVVYGRLTINTSAAGRRVPGQLARGRGDHRGPRPDLRDHRVRQGGSGRGGRCRPGRPRSTATR
ncbi:single-stranded DNA-binding protein [Janibacter limosus]|uniref:Single-stranded DNA-binding protein n=1 Tax=Janibacter limosus TaxID=53458 RepID=A0AC61U1J8_9MICO|nr:single-stranded DNA-binding protein [Janibacter limosus]UUZ43885.1 single-stranded DNA-binding protein [Janibacter limosus]